MSDATLQPGYCTNVHAGADLETTRANLTRHALAVKRLISPDRPMGVGLWLSAAAARKLRAERGIEAFGEWLAEVGLVPYTLNGFPHGDFHQAVVKHHVYEPTWSGVARLEYTKDLIAIQNELLPPGMEGTISTLPIAWGTPEVPHEVLCHAADQLRKCAERLAHLERETGRLISVCLEPEPGCHIQRAADVVHFFEEFLLGGANEPVIRRHLRVCHDVCHAAVMFEEQAAVLKTYHDAGISVGKVQVSSAVRVPFGTLPAAERAAAVEQLSSFAEDRYLHQTMAKGSAGDPVFHEDLPLALQTAGSPEQLGGEWRVHFHVPIYLERFGHLLSSRQQIIECLTAARQYAPTAHYEVETYAWGVLPAELRQPDLATGIAKELQWFNEVRA